MLWLASFAFYQDKINVSLPEKFKLKVELPPTYMEFFHLLEHKDTDQHILKMLLSEKPVISSKFN
jgi:hypothetical protein